MKLAWHHYRIPEDGDSRGYLSSGFHVYNALAERDDIDLFDCANGGAVMGGGRIHNKAVFHFCPPHMFAPVAGKVNILFTMWEADVLPPEFIERLLLADVVIVPSRYCQAVFGQAGIKTRVAPLGIIDAVTELDGSRATLALAGERRRPRFLFVGSKNPRKGWDMIAPAWRAAFERDGANVQLYLKTIGDGTVQEHFDGHVIIDQRDIETRELLELYLSADVFIFPSYAEGFGLPALEAMAAGCLVIAPETGGLTEFVNGGTALVLAKSRNTCISYGVNIMAKVPTAEDLAPLLRIAYDQWGTTELEARRVNGMRTARTFTWTRTAECIAEIVRELEPKRQLQLVR